MGSATAPLSGYGPQEVYVWLSFVSYDIGGNFSTWYWEVYYRQNGGAQWASDPTHYWELTGFAATGRRYFGIPSSWAGGGSYLLGNGYFTKGHDGNGYLPSGVLTATIVSSEGSIGSGSAGIASGAVQIPRVPPAPTVADPFGFDQITSTSARFRFQSTGDGGSGVLEWQFQLATNPAFTGATTYGSGGTTLLTDLSPGTTYYARARGRNAAGWGAWSATATMTTLAGIYVSDGAAWLAQPLNVSDGAAWASAYPAISDGDSWEAPINV